VQSYTAPIGSCAVPEDGDVVDAVVSRARRLWEELAGGPFPVAGEVHVIENPASRLCPPGWAGIVRLDDAVLVSAPTSETADLLRRTLDPASLPVVDRLGPAQLAYLSEPATVVSDAVEWVDKAQLLRLISAVSPDDAAESGIPRLQRAAVVRQEGRIVAAAGWAPWPTRVAHLCVLSHPSVRGRGLATNVAAAATADALTAGMLPQWRARVGPSQRIAAKLGYRVLGEQVSLRLAT
jgi:RimJ/RimL family protein N-acetyltransferase